MPDEDVAHTSSGTRCELCDRPIPARPSGTVPDTHAYTWVCWDCFVGIMVRGPADADLPAPERTPRVR
jgi:hypothetical protein